MRLHDFAAWRAARELAADVYRTTRGEAFATDATLRLEMRDRAATIMTSLAAAYEHHDCGGFRDSLGMARGAAAELESLLFLARDADLLTEAGASSLHRKVAEVRHQVLSVERAAMRYEGIVSLDAEETAS